MVFHFSLLNLGDLILNEILLLPIALCIDGDILMDLLMMSQSNLVSWCSSWIYFQTVEIS